MSNLKFLDSTRANIIKKVINNSSYEINDIEGLVKLVNLRQIIDDNLFLEEFRKLREKYPIILALTKPRFSFYDWLRYQINSVKEIERRIKRYKNIVTRINENVSTLFQQNKKLDISKRILFILAKNDLDSDDRKNLFSFYNNIINQNLSNDQIEGLIQNRRKNSQNKIKKLWVNYRKKIIALHNNKNNNNNGLKIKNKVSHYQINENNNIKFLRYKNEEYYLSYKDPTTEIILTYPLPNEWVESLQISGSQKKYLAGENNSLLFEIRINEYDIDSYNQRIFKIINILLKNKIKYINLPGFIFSIITNNKFKVFNLLPNAGYIDLSDYFILKDLYLKHESSYFKGINFMLEDIKKKFQALSKVRKIEEELYKDELDEYLELNKHKMSKIMANYDWVKKNFIENNKFKLIEVKNFYKLLKDLKTIHENNLFHLDIKLHNIMINKNLELKLIDTDNMFYLDENPSFNYSFTPGLLYESIINNLSSGLIKDAKYYQMVDEFAILIVILKLLKSYQNEYIKNSYNRRKKMCCIRSIDQNYIESFVGTYIKIEYRQQISNLLNNPKDYYEENKDTSYLFDKFISLNDVV